MLFQVGQSPEISKVSVLCPRILLESRNKSDFKVRDKSDSLVYNTQDKILADYY